MYQLLPDDQLTGPANTIKRLSDNAFIPFDQANTDYIKFKKEINEEESELQDADGNVMTAQQAKQFIATLP
jgi:hypothetical protein